MTTTEWVISISLVLVVLRQIRPDTIDAHFVLVPVALVGFSASHYLRSVPTGGHDVAFFGLTATVGAALGLAGGCATRVRRQADGRVTAQATWLAASLWVGSMSARIALVLWATHGGAAAFAGFSQAHQITGADAWAVAFMALAVSEVTVRIATIVLRGRALQTADRSAVALAA